MPAEPTALTPRPCWCGNATLDPFGPDYGHCRVCDTLVSQKGLAGDALLVRDDESDFYGKNYWLGHQQADLGFPDIHARSRADLSERNLHWLRALLPLRPPPARVLELGCAHGSFVALLRQCGYDAAGAEMSPWVVEFARATFGITVHQGPIETLDLAAGSLDCIALMDVLEHMPDPMATMGRSLELLRPDGLLLIQTPRFVEDRSYDAMVQTQDPFLEQMKADEHLYLFSERAARLCFSRLGAAHVQFMPAIFAHYDMFFAVSRLPLPTRDTAAIEAALVATPGGRIARAMLDLYDRGSAQRHRIPELEQLVWLTEQNRDFWRQQSEQQQAQVARLQSELDRVQRRWWYRAGRKIGVFR